MCKLTLQLLHKNVRVSVQHDISYFSLLVSNIMHLKPEICFYFFIFYFFAFS